MQSDHLRVSVTRRLPKVVENRMDELFDVEFRANDAPMTKNELINKIHSLKIDLEYPPPPNVASIIFSFLSFGINDSTSFSITGMCLFSIIIYLSYKRAKCFFIID